MRSVVSAAAHADLLEIVDFIAADSPAAAADWLNAIYVQLKEICRHPLLYPSRDDLVAGIRLCPYGAYNIYFTIRQDEIFFVRVLHSARDISKQQF